LKHYERPAVVDPTGRFVRVRADDREGRHPLACGIFPFSHRAQKAGRLS
jgi:hypothetical protein